jgi:hypothetical protein
MSKEVLDCKIYSMANEISIQIVNDILKGFRSPTHKILGEAKKTYEELDMFKWFDIKPLEDNEEFYIKLISMQQYKNLLWKSKQPEKKDDSQKVSKWEKVMGSIS